MITSTRNPASVSGFGLLLLLAAGLVTVLGVVAAAGTFQGRATAVTYTRTVDTRTLIEAAAAALSEAVSLVRASLDSGRPQPGCPDNWRYLVISAMTRTPRPAEFLVETLATNEGFLRDTPDLTLEKVRVKIVSVATDSPAVPGRWRFPPQATLEMSVAAHAKRSRLNKTLRQRRVVYLTLSPTRMGLQNLLRRQLVLLPEPIGTVIE
jgi:hypothetical protein